MKFFMKWQEELKEETFENGELKCSGHLYFFIALNIN